MRDPRYSTLLNILDRIRSEAPQKEEFRRFRSKNADDITFARGQAFIHLLLLIKFGLETFEDRNQHICDGQADGGLDAYYISEQEKTVFLVQSKFKNTESGFKGDSLSALDFVKMELDRIIGGEITDSNGVPYNAKIHEFQLKLNQATRKQVYTFRVVFLANLKTVNDVQLRKLTTNLDYEIYDFEKCYLDLVKPICSGTYYDPEKIVIELGLSEKSTPQLRQTVRTTYGDCDVTAVFVPTKEIGRVMSKFKNAILRYNPRNYLGLSRNLVNKEIRKSISSLSHNDFALLNNGITILADEQEFTIYTGTKNVGRLTLTNPQIINGGQTAYTLSDIYEKEWTVKPQIFDEKEVLVRVVVLKEEEAGSAENRYKFIDEISTSTNQQTLVKEADRHSSNPILVNIQKEIFRQYGYFLELKQGECYNGRQKGYIAKQYVVPRIGILRAFIAFSGRPTPARRYAEPQLFENTFFSSIFREPTDVSRLASEMFFAYRTHDLLVTIEKKQAKKSLKYGYALRYGKYACVYASALTMDKAFYENLPSRSLQEVEQYVDQSVEKLLATWKDFEDLIQRKETNRVYFNPREQLTDFDTYYKGATLKSDIEQFFSISITP
jgi:hypothetical protein